jgi:hypothetical protein
MGKIMGKAGVIAKKVEGMGTSSREAAAITRKVNGSG